MAKRSLLEVFIIMRNNSLQSRNIYSDRVSFISYLNLYIIQILYIF